MVFCSTGNPADGSDTDEAKQFITTTNKKAAIKVHYLIIEHLTILVAELKYQLAKMVLWCNI